MGTSKDGVSPQEQAEAFISEAQGWMVTKAVSLGGCMLPTPPLILLFYLGLLVSACAYGSWLACACCVPPHPLSVPAGDELLDEEAYVLRLGGVKGRVAGGHCCYCVRDVTFFAKAPTSGQAGDSPVPTHLHMLARAHTCTQTGVRPCAMWAVVAAEENAAR